MNYIVLEYLGKIIGKSSNKNIRDKNNEDKDLKKVYIIKLENESIEIGRNTNENKNNDINIPEPSISRFQAVLKFNKDNGDLIIKNRSKNKRENTSTFILIKDNFELKENKIKFMTGNSYITINLKKNNEK